MHDCINCGCACYCHDDIDDCVVEPWAYSAEHCIGCGCEEGGGVDDEYDMDGSQLEQQERPSPHKSTKGTQ